MIGVSCHESQREAACEFFELFKTPWEFLRAGRTYDAILNGNAQDLPGVSAGLVLDYSSAQAPGDAAVMPGDWKQVPLYAAATKSSPAPAASKAAGRTMVWMGYDLFAEIQGLLRDGQPAANASVPAMEWHIENLRRVLMRLGQTFVEVPPAPYGYEAAVCLTHDLDHVSVRDHFCDHTMAGFVMRASAGTAMRLVRNRISARAAAQNVLALATLPFVYAGMAHDFWAEFVRYGAIEAGLGGTYFVIPFKGMPGQPLNGPTDPKRGAGYDLLKVAPSLRKLAEQGNEIGVHGIDAWCSDERGRVEKGRVADTVGCEPRGIRMHWLYFDAQSPQKLEAAGYDYDSTVGYNETVGFRAGTAQVFRAPGTKNLAELPLIAMDTALFYPSHLDLGPAEAEQRLDLIVEELRRWGGVLTINWHDRSICPERQWGDFYVALLERLKAQPLWFARAGDAVRWYRHRRAVRFSETDGQRGRQIAVESPIAESVPSLKLRVQSGAGTREMELRGRLELSLN